MRHPGAAPSVSAATLLVWAACSEPATADQAAQCAALRTERSQFGHAKPVDVSAPVRLADLLAAGSIHSPLTEIASARGLEQLGEVPHETILHEDFEQFDLADAGWPESPRSTVGETDDGHAFVVHHHERELPRRWVLAAEPNTHYVFERRIRAEGPVDVDFAVIEATDADELLEPAHDPHYLGLGGAAMRMHWPKSPEAGDAWQRGSVSFFTTPQTRAIAVALRATTDRRAQMFKWGVRRGHAVWFDDLRLRRVDPRPEQAIALLKAQSLAPGSDPALGIHKHGQFPPLGEVGTAHHPRENNHSHRYALYAPPPTDLRFRLELTAPTTLYFSTCLSKETRPGHGAAFEVIHRADGDESVLWRTELTASGDAWGWHEANLDLSPLSGTTVELALRTTATVGSPHPMWGSPVLDVAPADGELRNVILIAVDTLRADRLSCYGYANKTSPRIDALASDGVRFEHATSNSTWTCPSFASIFTGVVPSRHGVWAFGTTMPLPQRFVTLAERFRSHGWSTHSIVYKAPLYNGGYEQGFDVAFNVPRSEVRADDNLVEAMRWLESHADRRNFLFLHFDDPHQPFTQPAPWDREFGADPAAHGFELPISFEADPPKDPEVRDLVRKLYDGEIAYVDERIGAFLDALVERGLYDDAVIAFVSDHGEELWEHGKLGHGGAKLHDEVVRVPLIVKGGAKGRVVRSQVRVFDVMPTLLELAGIPVEEGLDAETLVPMLAADAADAPDRVAVTETRKGGVALRSSRWKYILKYWRRRPVELLFDLAADPGELQNVARDHRDVVQRMRLQTLEYFMLRRPGFYVVGIGEPVAKSHKVTLQGVTSAVAFFGLQPGPVTNGSITFQGKLAGPLLLVAEFDSDAAITLRGKEHALVELPRYAEGDLLRLLREGRAGMHLFAGPPRVADEQGGSQTMDLQQLEALRALGYVGDGGENK